MKNSKNWFTWTKKRPKKQHIDTGHEKVKTPESRKNTGKKFTRSRLGHYFAYIKHYLKVPLQSEVPSVSKDSFHGLTTLLLISLFNALSLTAVTHYILEHYTWFANISILPGLSFEFIPWIFALQVFLFLVISLWLLPAMLYYIKQKFFNETLDSTMWLSHFYGNNVVSLLLSFAGFAMGIIAPVFFFIIIIFVIIIQFLILIVTSAFALTSHQSQTKIPIFYWTLIIFTLYIISELLLIHLIF